MSDIRMITVHACDRKKQFPAGTSYAKIAEAFQEYTEWPILLAEKEGSGLRELRRKAEEDCRLKFLTLADKAGRDTYRRSLSMMMLKAFSNVCGPQVHVWIRFSVSGGLFCTVEGMEKGPDPELLKSVKAEMESLRDRELPFEKHEMFTNDAAELFSRNQMLDKAKLFRCRISSRTNVYTLGGMTDYNYGYMVKDTSQLTLFDLVPYEDGFVLMCPLSDNPGVLPPFAPVRKLFAVQNASRLWGEALGIDTVGDMNELITAGKTKDLILMQEALQEKRIAEIAQQIADREDARIVLIAGPSSSGKTTFSHRLSIQLSVHGLTPHPIPMDDYFKNRDDTPLNPDGTHDFECLEAIDIEQFGKDMTGLLEGQEVELPRFNFLTGLREYKGKRLKLGENDILVIEGIHGLNDKVSALLPDGSAFRIYISALTQLNIDEHNRIPTTDGRMLRRIVRDLRTRGYSAANTIAMWGSVRKGEDNYIFPHQERADAMFNSALIYELAVLKTYAQPALFAVPRDSEEWQEAKRLLKFLDYFLPIPADDIPKNSLLREFIGGGTFDV